MHGRRRSTEALFVEDTQRVNDAELLFNKCRTNSLMKANCDIVTCRPNDAMLAYSIITTLFRAVPPHLEYLKQIFVFGSEFGEL